MSLLLCRLQQQQHCLCMAPVCKRSVWPGLLFHVCWVTQSDHPVLVCQLKYPPGLQVEDAVQKHQQLCFTLQLCFTPLPA